MGLHLHALEVVGQDLGVAVLGPFQIAHRPLRRLEREGIAGAARRGQHEAADLDGVAHHVAHDAAALLVALPEPGLVRAGVLFGGARQVGATGRRHRAAPDDLLAALNGRGEHLVLQIAVRQAGRLSQAQHFARLGQGAPQRLLAGDGADLGRPGLHRVMDRLHGLQAPVVGNQQPDRIHVVGGQQAVQAGVATARTQLHPVDLGDQRLAVRFRRAEDAGDLRMADRLEALCMELGDEARPDETDPQGRRRLRCLRHALHIPRGGFQTGRGTWRPRRERSNRVGITPIGDRIAGGALRRKPCHR